MAKAKKEPVEEIEKSPKERGVCPVCFGRGFDDNSSPEDKCNHCKGTGKYKKLK